MLIPRIMPCLLLKNGSLVKTIKFKEPAYIGDPLNAVRIYNEKEVDELIFLDIDAGPEHRPPSFELLAEIATECFMPVTYGGGIRTIEDAEKIFNLGIEKVAINSCAIEKPALVRAVADKFGAQSIVVSIDVRKNFLKNYEVYSNGGRKKTGLNPIQYAVQVAELGAGEILLTSIDRDGTQLGYDLELVHQVADAVNIPVIACGGAGRVEDFRLAVKQAGAAACAAGSMMVYFGRNRAVLVNFPTRQDLETALH